MTAVQGGPPARRRSRRRGEFCAAEWLETRLCLSVGVMSPALVQDANVQPSATPSGVVYTPSQITAAYGISQIQFAGGVKGDGTGQTIAVIDPYRDTSILADLQTFDAAFNLPAPPSINEYNELGQENQNLPGPAPTGANSGYWGSEISLDVEWAHAIAPGASIAIVEATTDSIFDLRNAAAVGAAIPGVSVVSMSFGGVESELTPAQETYADEFFVTPAGHSGVTFIAASGDAGNPGQYPAYSPNVLAVGGTSLLLSQSGGYGSETGWGDTTPQNPMGPAPYNYPSSGGGVSSVEPAPAWQKPFQPFANRTIPDVSFDADPNTGVPIADSYDYGTSTPWVAEGGTSFSAPAWAALIAITNQGRALAGNAPLDGVSQTLPMLYGLGTGETQIPVQATDFHDIVAGSNFLTNTTSSPTTPPTVAWSAHPSYDLVTGLGTPVANVFVHDMGTAYAPPVLNLSAGDGVAFSSRAIAIDYHASVTDPASGGFNGGVLTIQETGASGPNEVLDFANTNNPSLSEGLTVSTVNGTNTLTNAAGVAVGTYTGSYNSGANMYTLTIDFNGLTSVADVTTIVQNVSLDLTASDNPTVNRTVTFQFSLGNFAYTPVSQSVQIGNVTAMYAAADLNVSGDGPQNVYTASYAEMGNLMAAVNHTTTGYTDETVNGASGTGKDGFSLLVNQVPGATAVYRLYNKNNGAHYYTTNGDASDVNAQGQYQGEVGYLVALGWNYEEIAGYVMTAAAATAHPEYGLVQNDMAYNTSSSGQGARVYTIDAAEVAALVATGDWASQTGLDYVFAQVGVEVTPVQNQNGGYTGTGDFDYFTAS